MTFWLFNRFYNFYGVTSLLYKEKYSGRFDPSYTLIGKFAAKKVNESLFIAADWGFTHQLFLLTGGKAEIFEPFWNYSNKNQFIDSIRKSNKKFLYVFSHKFRYSEKSNIAIRIITDIRASDFFRQIPAEEEISDLQKIRVEKYKIL